MVEYGVRCKAAVRCMLSTSLPAPGRGGAGAGCAWHVTPTAAYFPTVQSTPAVPLGLFLVPAADNVLPRIKSLGYNAIQLMAIQVGCRSIGCSILSAPAGRDVCRCSSSALLATARFASAAEHVMARLSRCLSCLPLHMAPHPPISVACSRSPTQEHAYYGSFGYHVTNPFAVSSRSGARSAASLTPLWSVAACCSAPGMLPSTQSSSFMSSVFL